MFFEVVSFALMWKILVMKGVLMLVLVVIMFQVYAVKSGRRIWSRKEACEVKNEEISLRVA